MAFSILGDASVIDTQVNNIELGFSNGWHKFLSWENAQLRELSALIRGTPLDIVEESPLLEDPIRSPSTEPLTDESPQLNCVTKVYPDIPAPPLVSTPSPTASNSNSSWVDSTPAAKSKVKAESAKSRIATLTKQLKESQQASGSKSDGPRNYGSSTRSNRTVSRLKAPGSASKDLTESAAKRRRAAEEKRVALLQQQIKEKEEKALAQKDQLMQQKMQEAKQKREEQQRQVALRKEQLEKEERERRLREDQKKDEVERRKRENQVAKKEEMRRKQEQIVIRQQEAELRKLQEEKDRLLKQRQQDEMSKKKFEEAERARIEHERITAMIHQHNSSLQHKALANSFIKKTAPTTSSSSLRIPVIEPEPPRTGDDVLNSTYTLPAEAPKPDAASYMSPPPPPPKPKLTSYDISDLKSDAESDDEHHPKKPVPEWTKGKLFMDALTTQYHKRRKHREREVRSVFPEVPLPVELGLIFKGAEKTVSSRYAKRTSSAHWSSPPAKLADLSFMDATIASTSRRVDGDASFVNDAH